MSGSLLSYGMMFAGVFDMGLGALADICTALIAHGKDAATPAAVVAEGTTLRQQVVTAPLGALARAAQGVPGPALIIVGSVVGLHETLAWFSPQVADEPD